MSGVPFRLGWGKPLAQLIARGLSDQCHRHLAIANVEIARSRAVPPQGLMSIKELLHVPAFRKMFGQLLNLVPVVRPKECALAVFFRPLPLPLDELVERPSVAVLRGICQLRGRITLYRRRNNSGGNALSLERRPVRLGIGTSRSKMVSVLTLSKSSAVKCSESARTSA